MLVKPTFKTVLLNQALLNSVVPVFDGSYLNTTSNPLVLKICYIVYNNNNNKR